MAKIIMSVGEICVDWVLTVERFPEADEKLYYLESSHFPGGVIANYSVGVARLGGDVYFIGGVGKDEWGDYLVNHMKNEGVKTDYMFIHKDKATAINFIIVDREGTKRILQDPGLRTNIPEPSYFDGKEIEELMNKVAHVHLSATRLETALAVAKKAREKGLTVSLDLESHAIVSYGKEQVLELLRNVDLLLPNKLSLKFLFGEVTPEEGARKLLGLGPKTVVITLGERGCLVAYGDRTAVIPVFKIKPVDTTGAGDAFNAAFTLFHIIEERSPEESALLANAAAALKCLKLGAQTGMPRRDELRLFLEKRNLKLI